MFFISIFYSFKTFVFFFGVFFMGKMSNSEREASGQCWIKLGSWPASCAGEGINLDVPGCQWKIKVWFGIPS